MSSAAKAVAYGRNALKPVCQSLTHAQRLVTKIACQAFSSDQSIKQAGLRPTIYTGNRRLATGTH